MPQGGMLIQFNNIATPKLWDLLFDDAVFAPPTADGTDLEGTILGRVTADSKLVPFTGAATHGAGSDIPVGVLGTEIVANAVPDDENIRYIVSGAVREDQLIIDGGVAGAGITEALKDQLRNVGITPLSATDISLPDNS